ncbi:MAG: DinB family protein [Acidobacteria bacterium]|nr:DinB family protein [Acidobacteriota bacterium]
MRISDTLLPEFDRETAVTRMLLERVPDGRFDWKPHPTSMTLGRLAAHLAELPHWVCITIAQDSFDVTTPRPEGDQPPATREAVLSLFDEKAAAARSALAGRGDGELMAPWTLLQGKQALFTMPKVTVLRTFVFNHLVHHRGQLSVYLRMQGVPIPAIYGASGDQAV